MRQGRQQQRQAEKRPITQLATTVCEPTLRFVLVMTCRKNYLLNRLFAMHALYFYRVFMPISRYLDGLYNRYILEGIPIFSTSLQYVWLQFWGSHLISQYGWILVYLRVEMNNVVNLIRWVQTYRPSWRIRWTLHNNQANLIIFSINKYMSSNHLKLTN